MKNLTIKDWFCIGTFSCTMWLSGCQTPSFNTAVAPVRNHSDQMMQHLQHFQDIALTQGGNRAVGTLGSQASARYILAQAQALGLNAQMLPFENRDKVIGQNILVSVEGENKHKAILIGAHYDSVTAGPGINDNASGVAVLLEILHQIAQDSNRPKYSIVFAFWDSEEVGLAGSTDYLHKLSQSQREAILAYINVDMVGTHEPTVLIPDVKKTSVAEIEAQMQAQNIPATEYQDLIDLLNSIPHHADDTLLQQHLMTFFKQKNIKLTPDISTLIASDSAPFLGKVPVASLIFVNQQLKGHELEFVPCYHKACDTIDLIEPKSLELARQAVLDLIKKLEMK